MAAPQRGPSHRDGVSPAWAETEGCFAPCVKELVSPSWC